jgi:hypothetical protein
VTPGTLGTPKNAMLPGTTAYVLYAALATMSAYGRSLAWSEDHNLLCYCAAVTNVVAYAPASVCRRSAIATLELAMQGMVIRRGLRSAWTRSRTLATVRPSRTRPTPSRASSLSEEMPAHLHAPRTSSAPTIVRRNKSSATSCCESSARDAAPALESRCGSPLVSLPILTPSPPTLRRTFPVAACRGLSADHFKRPHKS